MEKRYLIFNTTEEAQSFAESVDEGMGYPNENTDRYSSVVGNPNNEQAAILTCQKCHRFMTQEQISSTVDGEEFRSLRWFPVEDIEVSP